MNCKPTIYALYIILAYFLVSISSQQIDPTPISPTPISPPQIQPNLKPLPQPTSTPTSTLQPQLTASQQILQPPLSHKKQNLDKRKEQILKMSAEQRRKIVQDMLANRNKIKEEEFGSFFQRDPLQDDIIRNQEMKSQEKMMEISDQKLNPWVVTELDNLPRQEDILTREQFSFIIKPYNQFVIKWNPSIKGNFKFIVNIYQLVSQIDLIVPQNPDQNQYILISAHNQLNNKFEELGKVYISKMFSLDFYTDYQIIKFRNFNDQKMIVSVDLEATVFVLEEGIRDDVFGVPAQRASSLVEELLQSETKQEKMFKAEWSFRDREERHQSEMLILTGVELIVILGTAIVQMWCIKQLLDNRIIV